MSIHKRALLVWTLATSGYNMYGWWMFSSLLLWAIDGPGGPHVMKCWWSTLPQGKSANRLAQSLTLFLFTSALLTPNSHLLIPPPIQYTSKYQTQLLSFRPGHNSILPTPSIYVRLGSDLELVVCSPGDTGNRLLWSWKGPPHYVKFMGLGCRFIVVLPIWDTKCTATGSAQSGLGMLLIKPASHAQRVCIGVGIHNAFYVQGEKLVNSSEHRNMHIWSAEEPVCRTPPCFSCYYCFERRSSDSQCRWL